MTPPAPGPIVTRNGSGVPILLLHALGADRRLWDALAALLPGRALLTYEFPATAGSGTRWTCSPTRELAAHHPDLVERLLLVDTVATYPPDQIRRWHERAAQPGTFSNPGC